MPLILCLVITVSSGRNGRFPTLYPHQPVVLRLAPVAPAEGELPLAPLPPDVTKSLMHKLNTVAAEHARRGEVCERASELSSRDCLGVSIQPRSMECQKDDSPLLNQIQSGFRALASFKSYMHQG